MKTETIWGIIMHKQYRISSNNGPTGPPSRKPSNLTKASSGYGLGSSSQEYGAPKTSNFRLISDKSELSKISDLEKDLFNQIDTALDKEASLAQASGISNLYGQSGKTGQNIRSIDDLKKQEDLYGGLESSAPGSRLNKYEQIADLAKDHVHANANQSYEENKHKYLERERKNKLAAKQKEKTKKQAKKRALKAANQAKSSGNPEDPDFFVTGVGLENASLSEDSSEDSEDRAAYLEEGNDRVDSLYIAEDPEMQELMDEVMAEIKQDCISMNSSVHFLY